jgi:tubulin polyglutamylase TTLL6/13
MSHQYKCSQPEDYSGNMCFHILGLDIMLNSAAEPILLEVNHTPSFTTDTPLDHKIKFNLIKDTLKLMNVNVQTKNDLFNRTKDLNMERLMTGKRQIYEGK